MTALITIRLGSSVVRSCDAKCYGAKTARCDCVCSGDNHGAGLVRAITQTRQRRASWLEEARANDIDFDEVLIGDLVFQPALFDMEEQTVVQMRLMGDDPDRVREVADLVFAILGESVEVVITDRTELANRRGPGLRIVSSVIPSPTPSGPIRATAERTDQAPQPPRPGRELPPARRRRR